MDLRDAWQSATAYSVGEFRRNGGLYYQRRDDTRHRRCAFHPNFPIATAELGLDVRWHDAA